MGRTKRQMTCSPIFLVLAFVAGLGFLLATPPLRFPDEQGHYLRSASLAEDLFQTAAKPRDTALVPISAAQDLDFFAAKASQVVLGRPFDLDEIVSRIGFQPPNDTMLVPRLVLAMQMMSGNIGYFPQAIAYELCSRLKAGFVVTLWALRLAVLIPSILVTLFALRLCPSWGRWTCAALNLLPMAVYLRASCSPDAMTTAMTVLGIAAFLDGSRRRGLPWSSFVLALAACLYDAVVKPPYICVLLLGLMWLRPGIGDRTERLARATMVGVIFLASLGLAAWHSHDVATFAMRLRPDLPWNDFEPLGKLRLLAAAPATVIMVFARTLFAVPGMAYSTIARFGWSDINPSPLLHVAVVLWCAVVIYRQRVPIVINLTGFDATVLLSVFAIQAGLLVVTFWLSWTDVRAPLIQGIQGRYFIPVLPCGGLGAGAILLRSFARRAVAAGSGDDGQSTAILLAVGAAILLSASLSFVVAGEFFGIQGFHVICLHDLCKGG